jgi:hypothetical protein
VMGESKITITGTPIAAITNASVIHARSDTGHLLVCGRQAVAQLVAEGEPVQEYQ